MSQKRVASGALRGLGALGVGAMLACESAGCQGTPKLVVVDLAQRVGVAERWCGREMILFGTPAAEPNLAEGFYREAEVDPGNPFIWAGEEAEVSLTWPGPAPRFALLDIAPYKSLRGQAAEVSLNGARIATLKLNDTRYRYQLQLPVPAQRAGDNRLRFRFAASGSPADADPSNPDKRRLAAAFYSLSVGGQGDVALEDLLSREAPRPFSVTDVAGIPRLDAVGPSVVRFAFRVPEAAELRFTPRLNPAARAAAASVSFHVSVEEEGQPQREIWARVVGSKDPEPSEVRLPLAARAGKIVRLGLHVGGGAEGRFAWGSWVAPRILAPSAGPAVEQPVFSAAENARGDALRSALAGKNVVLIILDAARAQRFGAYGYSRATTPEIDKIAAEGVVFERAFTPAVYTLGAMASLWTSQPPDRHHSAVSFSARLPKGRLTLADLLSARGITTGGFVANAVAGTAFGFEQGFLDFREIFKDLGSRADGFGKLVPPWLDSRSHTRFFLYLHFREPHFPYDPEPPFDTRFGPAGPISKAQRQQSDWIGDLNQARRAPRPGEIEHLGRLYDGNLAYADRELGVLRRSLEDRQLWDKTVVIVTADHGEGLFEHAWIGHNVQLYEPSMHVPLIVRFPKGTGPAGARNAALVDLLDLAPTIAEIFGVMGDGGSERQFEGRSLLPVVAGAPGKPVVLSRTVWDRPRYALRDERFKFIYDTRTGEEELFDLQADPGETTSRAAAEPVRAAFFRQMLHHWTFALARRGTTSAEESRPTPEQCENLKALGYVNPACQALQ